MKRNPYIRFLLIIFVISLFISTKKIPTKSEMIRGEVAERMARFTKKELDECTKKVLERAGELVDSTLIARARLQVKEITEKPEIPFRPDRPEVKFPKDTTPVVPIFPAKEEEVEIAQ